MNNNEPKKMSLEDYLGSKGLSSPYSDFVLDKLRGNRQLRTERGQKRFQDECDKHRIEYAEQREAAIKEYNRLVESGEIIPKTFIERTVERANAHPDNPSTQAARRICEKRGIDWRNFNER